MSKVLITDTHLINIANSIREKNGETNKYKPSEMAEAISNIETGGDTTIEDSIIDGSLTEYTNDRVSKVKNYMFYHDWTITSVDFPNVEEIGASAFDNCKNLSSINFPSATTVNNYAFKDCSSLTSIDLPLVTNLMIGDWFDNCTNLESVSLPSITNNLGGGGGGGFIGCSKLKNVNVPLLQTVILYMFNKCTSLSFIDLPSVTNINFNAFDGCTSLETIILRSETMCTLGSNVFNDTPIASGTGYIYVPSVLIDSYKTATNWSTYANQFRAIEDYPDICGEATV